MRFKWILSISSACILILFFQNCGSGFQLTLNNQNLGSNTNGSTPEGQDHQDPDLINPTSPDLPIIIDGRDLPTSNGQNFYVNKAGNDNNACTNTTSDACKTIQKGISVLSPGEVLNIGGGVYTDDGGSSPYLKAGTKAYFESTPTYISSFSIVFDRSGTKDKPITIRANPTNNQPVIVDGGHFYEGAKSNRGGIFMNYQDYIHIKNITLRNFLAKGIANWDHSGSVLKDSQISRGVLIEGCTIHSVGGGDNDTGIGMYSTIDWVVRNNHIYNIYGKPVGNPDRGGTGILSYGTINALVEHNLIEQSKNGLFWKDHYVVNANTREPTFESEIRYNHIKASDTGIRIGIQGSKSEEAGENYLHHNIIEGISASSNAVGINIALAGVARPTKALQRIEHNLIIGESARDSSGVFLSGTTDVRFKGNMIFSFTRAISTASVSTTKHIGINYADYNIFGSDLTNELVVLDRYSGSYPTKVYSSITAWRKALKSESVSLGFDHPGAHSREVSKASVVNESNKYRYPAGSAAIGLMSDSTNAGPYQHGNEVIGLLD